MELCYVFYVGSWFPHLKLEHGNKLKNLTGLFLFSYSVSWMVVGFLIIHCSVVSVFIFYTIDVSIVHLMSHFLLLFGFLLDYFIFWRQNL